jgi:hypothetical protein
VLSSIRHIDDFIQASFDIIDVHQDEDGSINLVLTRPEWKEAQGIPTARAILHFMVLTLQAVNDLGDRLLQIGKGKIGTNIANATAHIRWDDFEELFRQRGEPPNPEIISEHDNGQINAGQKILHVIVQLAELRVAILQFLVQGVEFLVGALQFLIAGLDLVVRRLELFVGRLLLLDDGLHRFLHRAAFFSKVMNFAFRRLRLQARLPGRTFQERAGLAAKT